MWCCWIVALPAVKAVNGQHNASPIYRLSRSNGCGKTPWAAVGVADVQYLASVTTSCAERTCAAASIERRRREPNLAGVTRLARGSTSPLSARMYSACVYLPPVDCICYDEVVKYCIICMQRPLYLKLVTNLLHSI